MAWFTQKFTTLIKVYWGDVIEEMAEIMKIIEDAESDVYGNLLKNSTEIWVILHQDIIQSTELITTEIIVK